ncbi:MAG: CPBP family intramembrane glutamic endopeptidase [Candidatus Korobacteraceae bacterium]
MNTETGELLPPHDATLIPTEPPPPPQPSTLHKIFVGKDGLRAGWSLLIYLGILAVLVVAVNLIGHKFFPRNPKLANDASVITIKVGFIQESIPIVLVLLVTWIMSKIERRPNSVYGLGGSRKLPHFFAGLAWGVTCLSLLVLTLWKSGLLVIDRRLIFGGDVLRYGAIWLLGFLLVGVLEEYLTRGYLQYTLTRGLAGIYEWIFKTRHSGVLGFWTAAIIFSILFGLGHSSNPGESPIGLLAAGSAGLVFCLSLWRTGSLWWAIGFHCSWDWAQSFLYGVADSGLMVQHHLFATHPVGKPILSGGATGPEGSIFIIAILALVSLIIVVTLPQAPRGQMSRGTDSVNESA